MFRWGSFYYKTDSDQLLPERIEDTARPRGGKYYPGASMSIGIPKNILNLGTLQTPIDIDRSGPSLVISSSSRSETLKRYADLAMRSMPQARDRNSALDFTKKHLLGKEKMDDAAREWWRDFVAWMLGRPTKNADAECTPWLCAGTKCPPENRNLSDTRRDISEFVGVFSELRTRFYMQLEELQLRGPLNLTEAFLYFKYLVRGHQNFLDDVDVEKAARSDANIATYLVEHPEYDPSVMSDEGPPPAPNIKALSESRLFSDEWGDWFALPGFTMPELTLRTTAIRDAMGNLTGEPIREKAEALIKTVADLRASKEMREGFTSKDLQVLANQLWDVEYAIGAMEDVDVGGEMQVEGEEEEESQPSTSSAPQAAAKRKPAKAAGQATTAAFAAALAREMRGVTTGVPASSIVASMQANNKILQDLVSTLKTRGAAVAEVGALKSSPEEMERSEIAQAIQGLEQRYINTEGSKQTALDKISTNVEALTECCNQMKTAASTASMASSGVVPISYSQQLGESAAEMQRLRGQIGELQQGAELMRQQLAEHPIVLEEAKQQISGLQSQITQHSTEREQMLEALQQKETEISALKARQEELIKEGLARIKKEEEEKIAYETKAKQLEASLAFSQTSASQRAGEIEKLQKSANVTEEVKQKVAELQAALDKQKQETEETRKQLEIAHKSATEASQHVEQRKAEIEETRKRNEEQLTKLTKEHATFKEAATSQTTELRKEIETLKASRESEVKELQTKMEQNEREKARVLKETEGKFEEERKKLKEEIGKIKSEAERTSTELQGKMKAAVGESTTSKQKAEEVAREKAAIEKQIGEITERSKKEVEALKSKIEASEKRQTEETARSAAEIAKAREEAQREIAKIREQSAAEVKRIEAGKAESEQTLRTRVTEYETAQKKAKEEFELIDTERKLALDRAKKAESDIGFYERQRTAVEGEKLRTLEELRKIRTEAENASRRYQEALTSSKAYEMQYNKSQAEYEDLKKTAAEAVSKSDVLARNLQEEKAVREQLQAAALAANESFAAAAEVYTQRARAEIAQAQQERDSRVAEAEALRKELAEMKAQAASSVSQVSGTEMVVLEDTASRAERRAVELDRKVEEVVKDAITGAAYITKVEDSLMQGILKSRPAVKRVDLEAAIQAAHTGKKARRETELSAGVPGQTVVGGKGGKRRATLTEVPSDVEETVFNRPLAVREDRPRRIRPPRAAIEGKEAPSTSKHPDVDVLRQHLESFIDYRGEDDEADIEVLKKYGRLNLSGKEEEERTRMFSDPFLFVASAQRLIGSSDDVAERIAEKIMLERDNIPAFKSMWRDILQYSTEEVRDISQLKGSSGKSLYYEEQAPNIKEIHDKVKGLLHRRGDYLIQRYDQLLMALTPTTQKRTVDTSGRVTMEPIKEHQVPDVVIRTVKGDEDVPILNKKVEGDTTKARARSADEEWRKAFFAAGIKNEIEKLDDETIKELRFRISTLNTKNLETRRAVHRALVDFISGNPMVYEVKQEIKNLLKSPFQLTMVYQDTFGHKEQNENRFYKNMGFLHGTSPPSFFGYFSAIFDLVKNYGNRSYKPPTTHSAFEKEQANAYLSKRLEKLLSGKNL